jgi:3-oxoacyl-(acyl-carrier-protein) synthase
MVNAGACGHQPGASLHQRTRDIHGPGDRAETVAIKRASATTLTSLPSARRVMTGHLLGRRCRRAIFSILAIRDGVVPPTLNLENPTLTGPRLRVPNTARRARVTTAVELVRFGGTNGISCSGHCAELNRRRVRPDSNASAGRKR